ncbi:unnamed protein product [Tuber aestivum]|uniref:Uncharacterized protein n=1 Tax=Tuber aestivum TaxID=59557 RepID=A0A292Q218_9PEZI|nr:unnamed protein product [Tuber aestivum]
MWRWRTDDIPHPMTGLTPEDQAYLSGNRLQRCNAGPSDANPSALPNATDLTPGTPSAPASQKPITPRNGRGRGRPTKILAGIKKPTRASTRKKALAQKLDLPTNPRQYQKGTKSPETSTPSLKEKGETTLHQPK